MAQKLSRGVYVGTTKLNLQLADTIKVNLVEFNKNKNYEIIFSNTASDNILYADENTISPRSYPFFEQQIRANHAGTCFNKKEITQPFVIQDIRFFM